jgi:hypothetical protein
MARVMDSGAYTAAARIVWGIIEDPDSEPDPKNGHPSGRLFLPMKTNLGPMSPGWRFSAKGEIKWCGASDTNIDEVMGAELDSRKSGPAPEVRERAEDWLRDRLADGEAAAGTIKSDAEAVGIKFGTLNNAAQSLGVRREKHGMNGAWTWRLPKPADAPSGNRESDPYIPTTLQPCNLKSSGNSSNNDDAKNQGYEDSRLHEPPACAREGGNGELFHGPGENFGLPDRAADRGEL